MRSFIEKIYKAIHEESLFSRVFLRNRKRQKFWVSIENNQGFFSYNLNDQIISIIRRKHLKIHKEFLIKKY